MTAKVYTDEVVARLEGEYGDMENPSAEADKAFMTNFAEELGVSVGSVRSKLVHLGLYRKYDEAKGNRAMTKAEVAQEVAKVLGMAPESLESLANGKRDELVSLLDAVR